MKPCRACNSDFAPTPRQIRKNDWLCKSCRRIKDSLWRQRRSAAGNPVIPTKMSREYHENYNREYQKNPEVLIKSRVRAKVRNAVVQGKLVKGSCEVCGSGENIEGHHDDYSKPLAVRWLCRKHHNEAHLKYPSEGA